MKVISKQRNSKMCIICGLDNPASVKAHFYNMEDGSVMTRFMFQEIHQSYPGRVHGGMITAMLDELGMRAYWIEHPDIFGVTTSLETKYRKPVPYGEALLGRGQIIMDSHFGLKALAEIMDLNGNVLASAELKYLKLPIEKIDENINPHEEMCYLIPDEVKEL